MPAPATPPADANCPAGFTCQDIHAPAKGSESSAAGTLTVRAAGTGIKGTGDQFRLVSEPVSGNSQASVTVTGQVPQVGLTQQAGLMVRQSAAVSSPFYAVLAYPNDSPPDVQVWAAFGLRSKNPVQLAKVPLSSPASLMIQRTGNQFSAGLSTDGVTYQLVPGSTSGLDLPDHQPGGPGRVLRVGLGLRHRLVHRAVGGRRRRPPPGPGRPRPTRVRPAGRVPTWATPPRWVTPPAAGAR